MVDALHPLSERLQAGLQAGESLELALHNGARPHGARSLGHPDPGAMSLAYCLMAATRPRE